MGATPLLLHGESWSHFGECDGSCGTISYMEKKAISVTLRENDNGKLQYLNYAVTASKSSSKAAYASWILFS